MPSFSDILKRQASEVERPKPLPVGTYTCQVKGLPRFDKSPKKGTDFVEFTLTPIDTLDDVDADALAEAKGLTGKTIRATFYLTEDALWRLKDFLLACGLEADRSLEEMINDAVGCTVNVYLVHTINGDSTYAEPKKFLPYGE